VGQVLTCGRLSIGLPRPARSLPGRWLWVCGLPLCATGVAISTKFCRCFQNSDAPQGPFFRAQSRKKRVLLFIPIFARRDDSIPPLARISHRCAPPMSGGSKWIEAAGMTGSCAEKSGDPTGHTMVSSEGSGSRETRGGRWLVARSNYWKPPPLQAPFEAKCGDHTGTSR
jgi:hypothetical protein